MTESQSQPAPAPDYTGGLEAEPGDAEPLEPHPPVEHVEPEEYERVSAMSDYDVALLNRRVAKLDAAFQAARSEIGRLRVVHGVPPWRVGSKVRRTLYDAHDALLGVMDTPELAQQVVDGVNATETYREDCNTYHTALLETLPKLDAAEARVAELVAEVAALKTEWAEHDGVPVLEARIAELERDRVAIDLHSRELIETVGHLRGRVTVLEAELARHE